ncbi:MAG TPA: chloride channel protein [Verrucomicrobiae bacterium]|nr:chloride channel protein [Verrucomicrobiae bacterium]
MTISDAAAANDILERRPPTNKNPSDFSTDKRVLILSAIAAGIGIVGAFVACALIWLINVITNLSFYHRFSAANATPADHPLGIFVILVPVLGALIIGLMARFGSPKIRGHGIPEALEAILLGQSRIEPKVAVLKPLSSAISIGTGGPFGAEGPIIMTGGAFGSLIAQFFHLSASERKTLLVAGAAAGMAAIFATPVAAVLLAVELLLFEWKPRSFIPVAVASTIAGALRVKLLGAGPIFPVTPHGMMSGEILLLALIVGIIAGLGSGLLTQMVYAVEDFFEKLPVHWMWWPVLGAVVVGVGGYFDPRVLGVGYDLIHQLLQGKMIGALAIGLLIGKALVWTVALGSGTSGGVLAPLLIIGGALGAIETKWLPAGDTGLWAMVSMAAIMAGTMRAPLTAMVFALELTHDLNTLPALLVGCVAAQAVTVLLLKRSILTEKIARRGHHIIREYSIDHFELLRVGEVMEKNAPTVTAALKISEFIQLIASGESPLARRQAALIVDEKNELAGIITRGDLIRALEENHDGEMTVLEAGKREVRVTYPDEILHDAISDMLRNKIGRMPVVSREHPKKILGYLGRAAIVGARRKNLEEETIRARRFAVS